MTGKPQHHQVVGEIDGGFFFVVVGRVNDRERGKHVTDYGAKEEQRAM